MACNGCVANKNAFAMHLRCLWPLPNDDSCQTQMYSSTNLNLSTITHALQKLAGRLRDQNLSCLAHTVVSQESTHSPRPVLERLHEWRVPTPREASSLDPYCQVWQAPKQNLHAKELLHRWTHITHVQLTVSLICINPICHQQLTHGSRVTNLVQVATTLSKTCYCMLTLPTKFEHGLAWYHL